jgi:acetyl esterase/lipase
MSLALSFATVIVAAACSAPASGQPSGDPSIPAGASPPSSPSRPSTPQPSTLLPDGAWQVELSSEELAAAGANPGALPAGVYTWTFEGTRARLAIAHDGKTDFCSAEASPAEGGVLFDYLENLGCGGWKDTIAWTIESDGLHATLVASTGATEDNAAYLQAKPWHPVATQPIPSWPVWSARCEPGCQGPIASATFTSSGFLPGLQLTFGAGEWFNSRDDQDEIEFDRDDTAAYFTCPAPGAFGICRWDPAKQSQTVVWSNPTVEPDNLLQGLADDSILGVGFMDGRTGTALFDGESTDAQVLLTLMKQFPGESVRFVSGTRDGSQSVVLVGADVDPGTFLLYDAKTRKLTPLLARMSWIKPERMAFKQPFDFAARDGMKLHGYLSLPPGQENAKHLPMVVLVHGGPFGVRDRWGYDTFVQPLATRGYAVLQVNYRGSGGYGYDYEHAGWREWGGKMQDDVTDATRWAIAQGIANPQRICIYGASYGGYAAIEGAVKEPDLYKCAIGYVGIYDLPLMYHRGDIPQSSYGEEYLKRQLGDDVAVLARHSPINQLDALKAHVMLVVGGKDQRVPPIQGLSLHQALTDRHIAHEWLFKPDEMHGFYDEAHNTELYTQLVQFLGTNIGPGVTK